MGRRFEVLKRKWRGVKTSRSFHNALVFLSFVIVAGIFWFVLAMNDSVTKTFDVRLKIVNVPDSVIFIVEPPEDIHVTLRDKGTNLLRSGVMNDPAIFINFRDFTSGSVLRFSSSDLNTALKATFGSGAQIGSVSIDSLYLPFTRGKGLRLPIVVRADISASAGNVIAGIPEPLERVARVYSLSDGIDTLTRLYTEPMVKRNLSKTTDVTVKLCPIPGARIIPSSIQVRIPIEPLVLKNGEAPVRAINVPDGMSILLFPATVPVSYYVPMSQFNEETMPVKVTVDYEETKNTVGNRLPLHIVTTEDYAMNGQLKDITDIEYALVKE